MKKCSYDKPKFTEDDREGLQWRIDNLGRQKSQLQVKINKLDSDIKILMGIINTIK